MSSCRDISRGSSTGTTFVRSSNNAGAGSATESCVIVLVAPSNALEDLLPLVPGILLAISGARRGEVRRVDG
jgi:hypothetical protein